MNETEGVVKYQLDYRKAPPVSAAMVLELNAWRRIMFLLGLIGQDSTRYGGYGYGNVSCRENKQSESFLITGTQTSHIPQLGPEHYTTVTQCEPDKNHIVAKGPVKPSSEALAHGALYDADQSIQYVFHAHCPEIWSNALQLKIPMTDPEVPYGTPEMAREFEAIVKRKNPLRKNILVMAGHEDGVVTYGSSAEQAGNLLVSVFSQSLQIIQ